MRMNNNGQDARLLEMVNRGLSHESETLSVNIQRRLGEARLRAVTAEPDSGWFAGIRQAISEQTILGVTRAQVSALVLIAATGVLFVLPAQQLGQNELPAGEMTSFSNESSLNEVDVLMSNEEMEFLENLEIYEWLAAEYG